MRCECVANALRLRGDSKNLKMFNLQWSGGGGTTRPLPRDRGAEELRGDPADGHNPKVWTIGQE